MMIIDLEQAMKALGAKSPASDMRLFLEQPDWRAMLDRAHAARAKVAPVPRPVRLGAPVPVPRSLIIAGANTKTHIAEAGTVLGETVAPRAASRRHEKNPFFRTNERHRRLALERHLQEILDDRRRQVAAGRAAAENGAACRSTKSEPTVRSGV